MLPTQQRLGADHRIGLHVHLRLQKQSEAALLNGVQNFTFLRQALLGAFRQARFKEQDLVLAFTMRRHHRRSGAAQQLFRTLTHIEIVGDTDAGAWPQRHFLQAQRRIDLRHNAPRQLHGVERPLNAFGQNGKLGVAQLRQHAVLIDTLAQLLRQRQQQRFAHRRIEHAGCLMQRLNADDQQVEAIGAQTGGDMLLQQGGKQRLVGQLGYRMARAQATHLGIGFCQPLLIAVVIAHQQPQLIVLVQGRQHQLVIRRFILRNIFQLFRHCAQRMHHQPVHTPADSDRQNQRQQQIGRQHGRQHAENELVHAKRIGLQHQISQRLRIGGHALQRIERNGNLDRQLEEAGDQRRYRTFRREVGVQCLKLIRQHDIRTGQYAHRQQGIQHPFGFRHIHAQHGLRQRLPHGMSNVFQLLGIVIPALLHKME
ncbi:hypothetical protein D3C79_702090 [compost metagenome]